MIKKFICFLLILTIYYGQKVCECPQVQFWNNVTKKCEPIIVPNCFAAQKVGDFSDGNKCEICDSGFYKTEAGACVKALNTILYCDLYKDDSTCLKCNSRYRLASENKQCQIIIDGCIEYDSNQVQNGYSQCIRCFKNYNLQVSKCMQKKLPDDCRLIDLEDDNYCSMCDNRVLHYLDSGICKDRQVRPDNCIAYNLNIDECIECSVGLVINVIGTICEKGISNCVKHNLDDKTKCLQCAPQFYGEKCLEVENTDPNYDPNCLVYNSNKKCQQCQQKNEYPLFVFDESGKCTLECTFFGRNIINTNSAGINQFAIIILLLIQLIVLL